MTARPLKDILNFVAQAEVFDAFVLELGSALYFPGRGYLVLFKPVYWDEVLSSARARLPAANNGYVLYYVDQDYYEQAQALVSEVAVRGLGTRTGTGASLRPTRGSVPYSLSLLSL